MAVAYLSVRKPSKRPLKKLTIELKIMKCINNTIIIVVKV